jgi:aspartate 1-decarboxylase
MITKSALGNIRCEVCFKFKIFRATVPQANVKSEGARKTIGTDLCDNAVFWIGEKVLVVSNKKRGGEVPASGIICINGASAHPIKIDEGIIMGFNLSDKPVNLNIVFVGKNNEVIK